MVANRTETAPAEPLPCPFCGGAVTVSEHDSLRALVCPSGGTCHASGLMVAFGAADQARAIAAWNTRAASFPDVGEVRGHLHDLMCVPDDADGEAVRRIAGAAYAALARLGALP